jgi:hypothetical protein
MYIDYDLRLSNKQDISGAAGSPTSTYAVDSIQSGWGHNDEVYARFMIQTAVAASASSSVTFAIQIAQDTAFGTAITAVSVIKNAADLTAKAIPLVVKLPVAMMTGVTGGDTLYNPNNLPYRYIRAIYTTGTASTAGKVTCDLVYSSAVTIDKAL